jgi:beta-glucanase (GH16 family)
MAGGLHAAGSWATRPGELQAYPNGDAIGQGALNPFSIETGALAITASKVDAAGMPFVSGALSTYPFAQTYGYFEMTAQLPRGRGLWPAFWLLPADDTWPPEIDVVETLGHTPGIDYTSIHTRDPAMPRDFTQPNRVADTSAGFHSYGVDWGPQTITFYFDRRKLLSRPTPADMHKPFYLTLNLAVGGPGSWPGTPDGATVFPAKMLIQAVTVWQHD